MDPPSQPASLIPPSADGRITRLVAAHAKSFCEIEPVLRQAGLTVRDIEEPTTRLGVRNQLRFLELASEALEDPLLGFHLATTFELRELGLLFYVQASSAMLGDALARVARYSSVVNEGLRLSCVRRNGLKLGIEYVGVARHEDRQQMEFFVTALVRIGQQLTGTRLRPARIALMHARRSGSVELERFIGQSVEFGSDRDEIAFSAACDGLPVVSADPYLNEALIRYWEDALGRRRKSQHPLRAAAENAILPLLPHGKARIGDIASALHLSTRTLARRLANEGLTFAQVLEEMRADLAIQYLEDRSLSISQIAWLLGFQEGSAFTHGFRRWTGISPTQWRKGERAPVKAAGRARRLKSA
jgi:AraC-like DNA-binding protein